MKMETTDLALKISQLGTGLARRQRSAESDIVIQKNPARDIRVKNLAVRLNEIDVALLDELGIWSRQNGLRVGWGTLLKTSLRMLHKDERTLHLIRQTLGNDGRRRTKTK